jgi:hypothetical protein
MGREDQVGGALAALNIGLAVLIGIAALKKGFAQGLAALTFLPMLAVSWPLTTLYFAVVEPEARYSTVNSSVRCLDGAQWVQYVVLVFLLGYTLGILGTPSATRRKVPASGPDEPRTELALIALGVGSVMAGWVSVMTDTTGAMYLVANAARNFFTGCLFIAGYRWHRLGSKARTLVVAGIGLSALMNTIANARGLAVLPVLMIALGYLLSPATARKQRVALLVVGLAAFPVYSVVGNQTRVVLGSIGFENLSERWNVLAAALSGNLQYGKGGFMIDVMLRLFSPGGHALITRNWYSADVMQLDLGALLSELAQSIVPAFTRDHEIARHMAPAIMNDYGFLVNESTSVDVSLPGSLFATGGLFFVFAGAVAVGAAQALLFGAMRWGDRVGTQMLARVGSLMAINIGAFSLDIVGLLRTYWWTLIYITVAWFILRLAVAISSRPGEARTEVKV